MRFGKRQPCIFPDLLEKRNSNDYIPSFFVETLVLVEPKRRERGEGRGRHDRNEGLDNPGVGSQRNGWVKLYKPPYTRIYRLLWQKIHYCIEQ